MTPVLEARIKKAPQNPGVYLFIKNKSGQILYIGKAANLRNRLKQYLNKKNYAPFLEHLLSEAEEVDFKITDSEIEALILESKLIKEKQPKYNIMFRDDKQYFYVGLSNENFPKVFITHQPTKTQKSKFKNAEYIGPFTDGTALKTTLRLLRRVFPYCTCKQPHHNYCLNYHIGNCLGYCCLKENQNAKIKNQNYNSKVKIYEKNIEVIKDILSGKRESLIKNLEKEMTRLGKNQEFEEAIKLRSKIDKLKRVLENAKIIQDYKFEGTSLDKKSETLSELKKIFNLPKIPRRIEGYDVSNIQGKNATGAMVVFTNGEPDKNEYRKFKIRLKQTPDDIAMLKEVLFRRFNHPEWPFPDLILIDGGIAQLNAAKKTVLKLQSINFKRSFKINIPIVSLAKGKNEVFSSTLKKPVPMKKLPNEIKNLILNIDSEAHRFAISYYRKLHRKNTFK